MCEPELFDNGQGRFDSKPCPAEPVGDRAAPGWLTRVDARFRAVWENRSPAEQTALGLYFLPHRSSQPTLTPTRPRVIKWYCPFAHQATFPTGHRYCLNVYTGCSHRCVYCYASGYEPAHAGCKRDFAKMLDRDLADLERFDVPPAPVHLSNSTDPFQPLEAQCGHTRRALEGLLAHRARFSTVTLLTKNPALAARPDYVQLLRALGEIPSGHPFAERWKALHHPAAQVEVSLAFWREEAAAFWDPDAPPLASRLEGVQALREAGIPIVLRVDPLFPRSPLPTQPVRRMADFGLPEAQTLEDLEHLVALARQVQARHVVYSPVKIVQPRRGGLPLPSQHLLRVYRALAAPAQPPWKGGSWRLPAEVARPLVTAPFLDLCRRSNVIAKFCMTNLLETL